MRDEPTQARRDELMLWIGRLWRGDWSGTQFDGRDGQAWINSAVMGDSADCDSLAETLQDVEDSYL